MKNFDSELDQDLTFSVQGQQFEMRYVRPEVLASWEDEPDDAKSEDVLKRQDERVLQFLKDEDNRKRWTAMRANEDNAMPLVKLNEVIRWMVEVQATRLRIRPRPWQVGVGEPQPHRRPRSSSGRESRLDETEALP